MPNPTGPRATEQREPGPRRVHLGLGTLTNVPGGKQMIFLVNLGVSLRFQLLRGPCVLVSGAQPWMILPHSWECCPGKENSWQTHLPPRRWEGAPLVRCLYTVCGVRPSSVVTCTVHLAVQKTLGKTQRGGTSVIRQLSEGCGSTTS